jgi:hypothetical protein
MCAPVATDGLVILIFRASNGVIVFAPLGLPVASNFDVFSDCDPAHEIDLTAGAFAPFERCWIALGLTLPQPVGS